jgi:flavin reductase (DIM6/NTAB) family NADH-FMN oxidoreductase RutF
MDWIPAQRPDVAGALDRIPFGSFVLTSAYGDQRGGVSVRWVQQCCHTPPMVMVAVEKGHALSPVIRDSRVFAICQLDPGDRATLRSFEPQSPGVDPFMGVLSSNAPSGAPVPCRALGYIDCELARHVDIDGDHEIYVGVVHHAAALRDPTSGARCLCEESLVIRVAATKTSAPARRGTGGAADHGILNGHDGATRNGATPHGHVTRANGASRLHGPAASPKGAAPTRRNGSIQSSGGARRAGTAGDARRTPRGRDILSSLARPRKRK